MNQQLIILASASPRRTELLDQIAVRHRTQPALIDETVLPNETPEDYVARMAQEKCQKIAEIADDLPVLGSDTVVVCDARILGKPADEVDHQRMMRLLSGRTHQVMTAVALQTQERRESAMSLSEVEFRQLELAEIAAYWRSGEPRDKAGGYAIQGLAAEFISSLRGSYSGVMGLPLYETAQMLHSFNIRFGLCENRTT